MWLCGVSTIVLAALVLVSSAGPGQAASIQASKSEYCNIKLAGPIEKGDADKLKRAIASVPPRKLRVESRSGGYEADRIDICLASTGGDFKEALKMVDLLVGKEGNWDSVGTAVDKGDECIAECAFIFMAGKYHAFHGISFPLRQLHPEGKLGFRLPRVANANAAANEADLAKSFAVAVKQVKELMEQNAKVKVLEKNKPFPKTLTAKVLALDDGETLYVETLQQLGEWTIQSIGLPKGRRIGGRVSDAMLQQACANQANWYEDPKMKFEPAGSNDPVKLSGKMYHATYKASTTKGPRFCFAFFLDDEYLGPVVDISLFTSLTPKRDEYRSTPASLREHYEQGGGESRQYGNTGLIDIWAVFDPATPYAKLLSLLE